MKEDLAKAFTKTKAKAKVMAKSETGLKWNNVLGKSQGKESQTYTLSKKLQAIVLGKAAVYAKSSAKRTYSIIDSNYSK